VSDSAIIAQAARPVFGDYSQLLTERITRLMTSGEYFSFSLLQTPFNLNLGDKLMAIDAYLQIDGIKGESGLDRTHIGPVGCLATQIGDRIDCRRPHR
jgi:hypothetical protein